VAVVTAAPLREVWLVRHGETEWSRTGQHTGRTDLPLTAEGVRQAEELGRRLAGRPFSLVLTSPLRRATDTCRLAGYGAAAREDDDLREWDYGAYEGRTAQQIREAVPDWTIWTGVVPGGERAEDVASRARRAIEKAERAGGEVALFAHGHLLRVLAACWLGLPPSEGRLFALGTASVSVLAEERGARVVRLWNEVGRLGTR
jgi:broad specificity phosphatase PhoE